MASSGEGKFIFFMVVLACLVAAAYIFGEERRNRSWADFLREPKRGMVVRTVEGPERLQELLENLRNEPCWIMKITSDKTNIRHTVVAECRED